VVKALTKESAPEMLKELVCRHPKWPLRSEVQHALLQRSGTPPGCVLTFERNLSTEALRGVVRQSRLSENVRAYLAKELDSRTREKSPKP